MAGLNRGVAGVLGFPMDTAANLRDLAAAGAGMIVSGVTGKAPPSMFDPIDRASQYGTSENIARLMDKWRQTSTQVERPDDPASRYLYAGGAGLAGGALLGPATGASVIPSALSNAAGSVAAQVAAENGAGPLGQTLAGMVGGAAPSALRYGAQAGARAVARGGEDGRLQTAQNIADFQQAGAFPSVGQATGTRRMQAAESVAAKAPGSAGVMAAASKNQAADIGGNIDRLANSLSPAASGEQAGRAIVKGVTGEGGFLQQFKDKTAANYSALDKFVNKSQLVDVSNTAKTLDDLSATIPGAENTSAAFANSKIASIRDALQSDLSSNSRQNNPAILQNGGNGLPYDAVKKLRTIVGNELADAPFSGDVPVSQWKKLYAAMSTDMEAAAKSAGPEAEAALSRANKFHAAGMKRLDVISSVIEKNGGPEAVFRAATSGAKEGATTLRAVMQSLPEDGQKAVSAGVLRRLGKANAGAQNAAGDAFSTETFLTNWNSMSPEAKTALFNRYGDGFRQDMDAVARVADNLRQGSSVFRNPSGTAAANAQLGAGAAFIAALASGNYKTALGVAAGVGTANVGARVLTNPTAVKWLAMTTRAPQSAIPAILAQAMLSKDPDIRAAAMAVKNSQ